MQPNFRYLVDIDKYLEILGQEIDELSGLVKSQQRILATTKKFNLSAGKAVTLLPHQYSLTEELYNKAQELDALLLTVKTSFKSDRGFQKTLAKIQLLKNRVSKQIDEILKSLSRIAKGNIPQDLTNYISTISNELQQHVECKCIDTDYYVYTVEGSLAFAGFIWLMDVTTDEGAIVSQLYVCVNWVVGNKQVPEDRKISIGYEWESPERIYKGSGLKVTDVNSAVEAVGKLLEMENFCNSLGTLPVDSTLRIPNTTDINLDALVAKDYVNSIVVDRNTLVVNLKFFNSKETLEQAQRNVFMDMRKLFPRPTQLRLNVSGDNQVLTFYVVSTDICEPQLQESDYNYFQDHWDLSRTQISKIWNSIYAK